MAFYVLGPLLVGLGLALLEMARRREKERRRWQAERNQLRRANLRAWQIVRTGEVRGPECPY